MERTSTWISSNTPAIGRDRIHWFMLFEVPYNLTSNTTRKEASMASLDNCAIITLWIKKLFLASHLNITSFTVKHHPISYHYSPCQRANFAHQCQTGLRLPESGDASEVPFLNFPTQQRALAFTYFSPTHWDCSQFCKHRDHLHLQL